MLNKIGCGDNDPYRTVICIRMSRINHACRGNCYHLYDSDRHVVLLIASESISTGTEICFDYTSQLDYSKAPRQDLEARGIVCPLLCICRNEELLQDLSEARQLDVEVASLGSQLKAREALQKVQRLVTFCEKWNMPHMNFERALYDAFQMAVMKRETMPLAKTLIARLCDLYDGQIPSQTRKYEGFRTNLSNHPLYLKG